MLQELNSVPHIDMVYSKRSGIDCDNDNRIFRWFKLCFYVVVFRNVEIHLCPSLASKLCKISFDYILFLQHAMYGEFVLSFAIINP